MRFYWLEFCWKVTNLIKISLHSQFSSGSVDTAASSPFIESNETLNEQQRWVSRRDNQVFARRRFHVIRTINMRLCVRFGHAFPCQVKLWNFNDFSACRRFENPLQHDFTSTETRIASQLTLPLLFLISKCNSQTPSRVCLSSASKSSTKNLFVAAPVLCAPTKVFVYPLLPANKPAR